MNRKVDNRPEAIAERIGLAREAAAKEARRQRASDGRTDDERRREANDFIAERIAQATPAERENIARVANKNGMHVAGASASEQAHQIAAETGRRDEKN